MHRENLFGSQIRSLFGRNSRRSAQAERTQNSEGSAAQHRTMDRGHLKNRASKVVSRGPVQYPLWVTVPVLLFLLWVWSSGSEDSSVEGDRRIPDDLSGYSNDNFEAPVTGVNIPGDESALRLEAEGGNAHAQTELGLLLVNGQQVPQDYVEAASWFRLAADQGNVRAQTNLGILYQNGDGVEQDYSEAARWFGLAAEQGYARAETALGALYAQGSGTQQDFDKAAYWFRRAAEQGDPTAQTNLGIFYQFGRGVEQNYVEAVRLFQLAADQGDAGAQSHLGSVYFSGHGVGQDYAEAAKWFRLAAEQGNPEAQASLGQLYYSGHGVVRNYTEAARWFRLASDSGHARGLISLGVLYSEGHGVRQDHSEAAKLISLAANQGDVEAQTRLGILHFYGQGIPQDYVSAAKWFRLAAEQGGAEAQASLGFLYDQGKGVEQDYLEAAKWFALASQGNDPKTELANSIQSRAPSAPNLCRLMLGDPSPSAEVVNDHQIWCRDASGSYFRWDDNALLDINSSEGEYDQVSSRALDALQIKQLENRRLTLPERDVQPIQSPAPQYPSRALERGLSGLCEVYFDVDSSGQPYNVQATCSKRIFKIEAEAAVSKAKFAPKIVNGLPVERTNVVYPIEFNIAK